MISNFVSVFMQLPVYVAQWSTRAMHVYVDDRSWYFVNITFDGASESMSPYAVFFRKGFVPIDFAVSSSVVENCLCNPLPPGDGVHAFGL